MLDLMLCFWCTEILSDLIFELVFYKSDREWSMGVSRRDKCNLHAHRSLPPYLHRASGSPMSTGFQWTHDSWKFSKTQSKYKVNVLHL